MPLMQANRRGRGPLAFRAEWRDFVRFVRQPTVGPRLAGQPLGNASLNDWFAPVYWLRLLQWAGSLWAINVLVLGPIAVAAAIAGGAEHRLDIQAIPWLHALIWAPVVEELVFRYGLRRPAGALLVFPAALIALLSGPAPLPSALLALALLVLARRSALGRPGPGRRAWRFMRFWQRHFGLIVHVSCLAFAAIHLHNFVLGGMPLWLMPLLVLPQWATGLVLAWLRVRRGIGAAITLHALFNAGPLLAVWLFLLSSDVNGSALSTAAG